MPYHFSYDPLWWQLSEIWGIGFLLQIVLISALMSKPEEWRFTRVIESGLTLTSVAAVLASGWGILHGSDFRMHLIASAATVLVLLSRQSTRRVWSPVWVLLVAILPPLFTGQARPLHVYPVTSPGARTLPGEAILVISSTCSASQKLLRVNPNLIPSITNQIYVVSDENQALRPQGSALDSEYLSLGGTSLSHVPIVLEFRDSGLIEIDLSRGLRRLDMQRKKP